MCVFHNQIIAAHITLKISLLRSQENIQNMLTTLYVMKNVLSHCNAIVPHITLTMGLFRSQRACVLIRSNWISVIIAANIIKQCVCSVLKNFFSYISIEIYAQLSCEIEFITHTLIAMQ